MSPPDYVPPVLNGAAFHCPHTSCGSFAHQRWSDAYSTVPSSFQPVQGWRIVRCDRCGDSSLWVAGALVYPETSLAPPPNPDLPDELRADYEEARAILGRSPRGAAALLRLCVQKLCAHLGEKGRKIDDDIASLVKRGLPCSVQQALDAVRVIGSEAVHPGTIDLRDDPAMAAALFGLVNIVAEKMITEPKEIEKIYAMLPSTKRAAIEKRDGVPA